MHSRDLTLSLAAVLALTLASPRSPAAAVSVDLVTVGAGSWVYAPIDLHFYDETWFNKVSVHTYATLGPVKAYAGIPLAWTVDTWADGIDKQQFMLGDLQFYAGHKWGIVEPRLGASVPLGYSTDGSKAWIGSGNVKLRAGVALYADLRESRALNLSGDIMYALYLGNGVAYTGSWDILPNLKASVRPTEDLLVGLEVLGVFGRVRWGDDYYEYTASAVPNLYVEYDFGRLAPVVKVGFGPTVKQVHTSGIPAEWHHVGNSLNLSAALNIYP